jgi:hypothetical protein
VSDREWTEQVRVANEEFTRARETLLPRVKEAFDAASKSKRYMPPSDDDCRQIAGYLVNMRTQGIAKPRDYYYDREKLVAARIAGEMFLAALEAVKDPDVTDLGIAGMPVFDVSEAREQVRHVMRCLDETDDPVKFLDRASKAAWKAANGGKFPTSAEKDKSPRVEVVAALFDLANIEPGPISRRSVSRILKREIHRGTR